MKKSFFVAITALSMMMSSCFNFSELAIPESVAVKTDATYKASIGQKSMDFSDKINLKELLSENQSEDYTVYEYLPQNDTSSSAGIEKFLVEAKLQDIEIDFSKYFENTDIAESLAAVSFSQDIKVPKIEINKSQSVEIPEDLKTAQKALTGDAPFDGLVSVKVKFTPSIDDALKECQIGTGTAKISVTQPFGWSDVKITSVKISQENGVSVNDSSASEGAEKSVDLGSQKINAKEMTVEVSVSGKISKSADLDNPPVATVKTSITKFSYVTVDLGENFDPEITQESALPSEMSDSISKIVFASGTGIKGTFRNGLPAVDGNDAANKITLSGVYSDFLGLGSSSSKFEKEMPAGGSTGSIEFYSTAEHEQTITGSTKIDFNGELTLPGSDASHKSYLKAQELEAGKTYTVSLTLEPVINWSSVTINSDVLGDGKSMSDKIVLKDVDFTSMLNDFGETLGVDDFGTKVGFTELPFYIYCQKPTLISSLNKISVKSKINAYLGDSNGNKAAVPNETYIIGSNTEAESLNFVSVPTLSKNASGAVTTNLAKISATAKSDFAEIMNATLSSSSNYLCLNYDITTSLGEASDDGITIEKSELEKLKNETTSIAIYAYFVLPLQLNVKSAIDVDLLKTAGMDEKDDLLDREEATSVDEMKEYLSAIEYAKIIYKPAKLPFVSQNPLSIKLDLDGEGTNFSEETLYLSGGEISVNPEKLLSTYPLKPKIILKIPTGTLGISSDLSFDVNIQAEVKTNGTVTLFGGEK